MCVTNWDAISYVRQFESSINEIQIRSLYNKLTVNDTVNTKI